MNENIKNRSEILFYYDVRNSNPNGDPLDENKPRIDPDSGKNMVSDVRIKRTIRDYLMNFKGFSGEDEKDILIREKRDTKGHVLSMKQRAEEFGKSKEEKRKNILKKCIDIRLFGGTIALGQDEKKGDSITLTGPVQFNMLNNSKHNVTVMPVGHSFSMASKQDKKQGSMAPEYIVPYSFIEVNGIVNENNAEHTGLTEDDVQLLLEGLWEGTKNLITRSKFGQMPRLLIKIEYKEKNFHIGELGKLIELKTDKNPEEIRSLKEFKLDVTEFVKKLEKNKDKIKSVKFKIDERLKLVKGEEDFDLKNIGKEIEF